MRGFDKAEVDEFLDNVIQDYELFLAEIAALRSENTRLKARVRELEASQFNQTQELDSSYRQSAQESAQTPLASNYDILKRISRLELEVFGKQIAE